MINSAPTMYAMRDNSIMSSNISSIYLFFIYWVGGYGKKNLTAAISICENPKPARMKIIGCPCPKIFLNKFISLFYMYVIWSGRFDWDG